MKAYKKSIVVLVIVLMCVQLCGCSDLVFEGRNGKMFNGNGIGFGFNYVNYDETGYSTGNGSLTGTVEKLDIDWIAGTVNIGFSDSASIEIAEESKMSLTDSDLLRYKLDNGTLYIRFCASGGTATHNLSKSLTLVLPAGTEFDDVCLNMVSADVSFDEITTKSFVSDAVSGDVIGNTLNVTDTVSADTVSGDFIINSMLTAKNFDFDSTSGNLQVADSRISDSIDLNTVSGEVKLYLAQMCNINQDTTSGDFVLYVPADASFVLSHDSVSGNCELELPAIVKDDTYCVGDGTYKVDTNAVSGDVTIFGR